jgi:hypothetical protein
VRRKFLPALIAFVAVTLKSLMTKGISLVSNHLGVYDQFILEISEPLKIIQHDLKK